MSALVDRATRRRRPLWRPASAAERATTTPPEDPPAPTNSAAETAEVRRGQGEAVGAQGGSVAADRPTEVDADRRWRTIVTASSRGRSGVGRRIHPDLQISGAPLLDRRGRRVLRRGASRSLAPTTTARAASAARAPCGHGASLLRRCAQGPYPSSVQGTASDSTVLLCCSGSRSPAAVASLLFGQAYAHFAFGAGLAHIFHNWRRCRRPPTAARAASASSGPTAA